MPKLQVFDPAMCCSTGVCGPSVDPTLPRFAADLEWLQSKGVQVERYNLARDPRGIYAHRNRQEGTEFQRHKVPSDVASGWEHHFIRRLSQPERSCSVNEDFLRACSAGQSRASGPRNHRLL